MPRKQWSLVINVGSLRVKAIAVPTIGRTEHYLDDAFPVNTVTAMFQPSDVTDILLPGANRLEATLICKDLDGKVQETFKYRLVLQSAGDQKLANNNSQSADLQELNQISMSTVSFQMIDHASFDLRLATTGNVFNDTVPLQALMDLLGQHRLANEYGQSDAVAAVDFAPGFVNTPRHIVVRDNTPLKSVSALIQDKYGIYPQGCSCFLKDKVWYIFAPYSVASVGELTKRHRLVIINAPPNKYGHGRTNYRREGNTTTIIASGQTSHANTSDTDALNGSTGVMYAKAGKLLGGTSRADGGGQYSGAEDYMTEYGTREYKGQEQNITMPKTAFVSNEHKYTSMLASKAGDIVQTVWENGDISKLIPGVAVTFITQDENRIRTLYGTLLAAESHSSIPEKGIVETTHHENVSLTLFLKRNPRGA